LNEDLNELDSIIAELKGKMVINCKTITYKFMLISLKHVYQWLNSHKITDFTILLSLFIYLSVVYGQ